MRGVSAATEEEVATIPVLIPRSRRFCMYPPPPTHYGCAVKRPAEKSELLKLGSASVLLKVTPVEGRVDVTGDRA